MQEGDWHNDDEMAVNPIWKPNYSLKYGWNGTISKVYISNRKHVTIRVRKKLNVSYTFFFYSLFSMGIRCCCYCCCNDVYKISLNMFAYKGSETLPIRQTDQKQHNGDAKTPSYFQ